MEVRYIQRDEAGNVVGHYSQPNKLAQEEVAADDPDILAWDEARKPVAVEPVKVEEVAAIDQKADALDTRVAELEAKNADLEARIAALEKSGGGAAVDAPV